jgi:hypothetical protein
VVSDPVGKEGQLLSFMLKMEAERGKIYVIWGRGNYERTNGE